MSYTASGDWVDDGSAFVNVVHWCPMCPGEPEGLWETHYCADHYPTTQGDMDKIADTGIYLAGTGDAGGLEQAAMCRIIHRNSDEPGDSVR